VTVSNALFGAVGATTDSVNLVMAAAGFDGGTFTAANVETINLNATDTSTATGITAMTVVVTGDKATTLNVTGNAGAALTLTSSVKLATLDASASTGAVSATADSFVANGTTASTLLGNGGADTLTTNLGLTTLTGGAGNDLFVIPGAAANGNVYTTITDATAGDRIQLFDVASGTEVWNTTAISLAGTASFSDYLNAASTSGTGATTAQISWFAFGGNTYIVEDASDSTSFFAGTDAVVALTGVVDLSAASLNGAADPILMIG
jgi:S-layer protein